MIHKAFLLRLFFGNTTPHPPPCRSRSKYDAGQESGTGTPESSDVSSGEVLKINTRDPRTGTGRDRKGGGSPILTTSRP